MRWIMVAALFVFLAACGSDGGGGGGCEEPSSQPLSAPCCEALGVDACGAGLFCAAFDGRSQPTCYPERIRTDGEECSADRQCVSGSCNVEKRACRAIPNGACSQGIGCAPNPAGDRYACVDTKCERVGDGTMGAICAESSDCAGTLECVDAECRTGAVGAVCSWGSECDSGLCQAGRCAPNPGCTGGNGKGPCSTGPSSGACGSCMEGATAPCTDDLFFECFDVSSAYNRCVSSRCDDEHCDECASELCDLEECAVATCPAIVACF